MWSQSRCRRWWGVGSRCGWADGQLGGEGSPGDVVGEVAKAGLWKKIPRLLVWRWSCSWRLCVCSHDSKLEAHVEGQRGGGDRPLEDTLWQWGRDRDYQKNQDLVQHLHNSFMESVQLDPWQPAVCGNLIIGSHRLQYRPTSEGSVQIRLQSEANSLLRSTTESTLGSMFTGIHSKWRISATCTVIHSQQAIMCV